MNDDDLVRYARHLNLAGVGPGGQALLAAGQAAVRSRDLAGFVARRYLEAAGVGQVTGGDGGAPIGPPGASEPDAGSPPGEAASAGADEAGAWVAEAVTEPSCRAVVAGAVEALAAVRGLLDGDGA